MADLSFNTNAGQTIAREMLIVYLNTGTTASPVWSAVGKRVEDSSTEIDWDTETIRDILGATYAHRQADLRPLRPGQRRRSAAADLEPGREGPGL